MTWDETSGAATRRTAVGIVPLAGSVARASAVAVALALIVLAAAPASAFSSAPPGVTAGLARVLSPGRGGVAPGGTARVRIRLAAGVRSFRAWVGPQEVTASFSRSGRDRVANLRGQAPGPHRLYVRSLNSTGPLSDRAQNAERLAERAPGRWALACG